MRKTALNEVWRVCVGFPKYEVSNLARVRNLKTGHIKKQVIRKHLADSRLVVGLKLKHGVNTAVGVAKLVANAFLKYDISTCKVYFKDRNQLNCKIANLLVGPKFIANRAKSNMVNFLRDSTKPRGSLLSQDINLQFLKGLSTKELARKYKKSQRQIQRIVKNSRLK